MSVIARIQKRKAKTVDIDGEQIQVRSLAYLDGVEMDGIADAPQKAFYAIGMSLLDDEGQPAFTRAADESAVAFATRVQSELSEISTPVMKSLTAAITEATKTPSVDAIAKNSEETASPSS